MFSKEQLRNIIKTVVSSEEKLGDQVGGSGHMGCISLQIDSIKVPVQCDKGWSIECQYTLITETEFTYYPDNPPYEQTIKRTIIVNNKGDIIDKGETKTVKDTFAEEFVPPEQLLDLGDDKNDSP